ncbi:hypothetical protein T02_858 [Trichinella nativa]|uniref:Uncharacterized protein n=1 Tax=Trichinella nativa TaxID=6335 RepID=A0A0V1LGY0_9BILA|nr:hypothetical protein T02_858 [Trichinella nativa]
MVKTNTSIFDVFSERTEIFALVFLLQRQSIAIHFRSNLYLSLLIIANERFAYVLYFKFMCREFNF